MSYYDNPYRRLMNLGMAGWRRRYDDGGTVTTTQLDDNGNPVEAQISDYDIAVMDPATQRQYARLVGQTAGNQVNGVSDGLARYTTDADGNIVADNAYMLDDVVAASPDLRVAKMARERPDYQGLNEFANAAVGGLAGVAGLYGSKAWDRSWKANTGNDWNTSVLNGVNWIGDRTGLYQVNPNGRYAQLGATLTNPGLWLGAAGTARVLGRPSVIGAPQEDFVSTRGLNYADAMARAGKEAQNLWRELGAEDLSNADMTSFEPTWAPGNPRIKFGDLEINDPGASYRQGSNMIQDFFDSGKVRVNYVDDVVEASRQPGTHILLRKEFPAPMLAQGRLWYGTKPLSELGKSDNILVTREPLQPATKRATKAKMDHDGRRIPFTDDQLNLGNTSAYIGEPGYGYRLVRPEGNSSLDYTYAQ